jgi:hypothetical protein
MKMKARKKEKEKTLHVEIMIGMLSKRRRESWR